MSNLDEYTIDYSRNYNQDVEAAYSTTSGEPVSGVGHSVFNQFQQPRKYAKMSVNTAQPDHMSWSTASLFVCFIWGILAFRSSNKVVKYNRMKAYDEAAHHSQEALRYNRSAVACFVILLLILGVPLAIALAVQGSAYKFPNAHIFFG